MVGVDNLGKPFPARGAATGPKLDASEEAPVPARPTAGHSGQNSGAPKGSRVCPLLCLPLRQTS